MYGCVSNVNPIFNTRHTILNLAVYSVIDHGILSVPAPAALPDFGNGLHGTPCPDVLSLIYAARHMRGSRCFLELWLSHSRLTEEAAKLHWKHGHQCGTGDSVGPTLESGCEPQAHFLAALPSVQYEVLGRWGGTECRRFWMHQLLLRRFSSFRGEDGEGGPAPSPPFSF